MSAVPSIDRMLAWTCEHAVRDDGAVLSWVSASHPGYAYPEAAGLVLAWISRERPRAPDLASASDRVASWLARELSGGGGVGRDGSRYLFDTMVAIAGLADHVAAGGALAEPRAIERGLELVERCVEMRTAVEPPAHEREPRWSRSWGSHLLKASALLDACSPHAGAITARLERDLLALFADGRFRTHAASRDTYLHASCYALEGVLHLVSRGRDDLGALLNAGTDWLARVQHASGALPAWHDGQDGWGGHPADAVAQAVRLWVRVDRARYAGAIARGLAFLASLQDPSGGVRYAVESADVNTWATVFTAQAARWAQRAGEAERIL